MPGINIPFTAIPIDLASLLEPAQIQREIPNRNGDIFKRLAKRPFTRSCKFIYIAELKAAPLSFKPGVKLPLGINSIYLSRLRPIAQQSLNTELSLFSLFSCVAIGYYRPYGHHARLVLFKDVACTISRSFAGGINDWLYHQTGETREYIRLSQFLRHVQPSWVTDNIFWELAGPLTGMQSAVSLSEPDPIKDRRIELQL